MERNSELNANIANILSILRVRRLFEKMAYYVIIENELK